MPKTALQLVTRTQELLQLIEGVYKSYRRGLSSDDPGDLAATPILPVVNEFLSVCSLTGIKAEDVPMTTTANVREYAFSAGIARIITVYYGGIALRQTTRAGLNENEPAWLNLTGTPEKYFREGNKIVLDKMPTAGTTLIIRAGLALTMFTGAPDQECDSAIPETAQERLAYGAAYLQSLIDAENPAHNRRINTYKAVADGVIQELGEASDTQDYAGPVSIDEYIAARQRPLPSAADYLHYKADIGMAA